MDTNKIKIINLQPSQFYVSSKKLKNVLKWFNPNDLKNFEPVPIIQIDDDFVITDGHTRVVAAIKSGLKKIPVVIDQDDLDLDMYRACVLECKNRNINSPYDLIDKIVNEDDYIKKWNKWCDEMQRKIIKKRES